MASLAAHFIASLLVEEYRRLDGPEATCYLAFIRSQASFKRTSRSYPYYLACKEIEGVVYPLPWEAGV